MKKTNISREDLMSEIGKEFPNGTGVEVGVFKGQFSNIILNRWNGTLLMVDVWKSLSEAQYDDASNHAYFENGVYQDAMNNIPGFEDRAIMIRGSSKVTSKMFPDNHFDFVYIDANHAYDYVVEDISLWYPKVKPGGYLLGHDYIDLDWYNDVNFESNLKDKTIYDTDGNRFGIFGVNPAVDEFCSEHKYEPNVTREWFGSWWLKKKVETKKIAVLVVYDDNYLSMKKITVDNNIKNYCKLHNYDLIEHFVEDKSRHPAWYKISKSIEILKTNKYDWVFFIDLDCLIMNNTIKIEDILDENYSFIVPSHGIPAIDTPTITPFNTDNIITSQFIVKNDEKGIEILEDIWECKEMPEGMNFHTFDYEGRQTRVTILKPEFKPYVKIIEESKLNRFWYMNFPFMVFHNIGVNNLVWQPGDFIVHVTGYPKEERVKLLSDLNFFSGGEIVGVTYYDEKISFRTLNNLPYVLIKILDSNNNIFYEEEFHELNNKGTYSLSVNIKPLGNEYRIEGYNEIHNLISLNLITI